MEWKQDQGLDRQETKKVTEQTQRTKDEAGPKPAHTHEPRDRAAYNAGKGPRVDRPGVDGRTNDKQNRRLADQDIKHDIQSRAH